MKENEIRKLIQEEIKSLLNEGADREYADLTEAVRKRVNRAVGTIEKVTAQITFYVDGGHGVEFTYVLNGEFSQYALNDIKQASQYALDEYFSEQARKNAGGGYEEFIKLYEKIDKLRDKYSDDGYADTEARVAFQMYLDELVKYYKDNQEGTKPSYPDNYSEFTKRKGFYTAIERIYQQIDAILQRADETTLQAIGNYF